MDATREELKGALESYFRACGWKVVASDDGTVRAVGIGGVTWIGLPVVAADLSDPSFAERLRRWADERMPTGQLCPLEVLPASDCAEDVRRMLDDLGLHGRGHVEVYAVAA